ncbi:hypothetical protein [Nonomuraea longicatena]|uniref:Uncharacterized protein n=1 Tax=Nonomuraea longicatena TaxID=83682 RepID=A0ABP3ZCJ1_9ACTN
MSDDGFQPTNLLYVRPNPDTPGTLEILDQTLYPTTLRIFHFYGPAAPGNFYDDRAVYEALVEADHLWVGDIELGTLNHLFAFAKLLHEELTGDGNEFYGSGWTCLHVRPVQNRDVTSPDKLTPGSALSARTPIPSPESSGETTTPHDLRATFCAPLLEPHGVGGTISLRDLVTQTQIIHPEWSAAMILDWIDGEGHLYQLAIFKHLPTKPGRILILFRLSLADPPMYGALLDLVEEAMADNAKHGVLAGTRNVKDDDAS